MAIHRDSHVTWFIQYYALDITGSGTTTAYDRVEDESPVWISVFGLYFVTAMFLDHRDSDNLD